jgi:hypothetical protein
MSVLPNVPFDWFDGNDSDDEINLVTGQCASSSNPTARLSTTHYLKFSAL